MNGEVEYRKGYLQQLAAEKGLKASTGSELRRLALAEILDSKQELWPISVKHSTSPYTAVALHSHPFDEYLYVISGELTFWIGREQPTRYHLSPGDLLFVPEDTPHDVRAGTASCYLMGLNKLVPENDFMRWEIRDARAAADVH